jgi:hypothetical protein
MRCPGLPRELKILTGQQMAIESKTNVHSKSARTLLSEHLTPTCHGARQFRERQF